jgi:hypothetical protein
MICANQMLAVSRLDVPLVEIRDSHWYNKLRVMADLGLSVLAHADARALEEAAARPAPLETPPVVDFFPLTKWEAVINLAVIRDESLDREELIAQASKLCVCSSETEFIGIPRLVRGEQWERAVVAKYQRIRGY